MRRDRGGIASGSHRRRGGIAGWLISFGLLAGLECASAGGPAGALAAAPPGPGGAANLTLAPDLSFTDDSSSNFPIRGEGLKDGKIASDRPTFIFFGTSHCWNTNREAERLVAFYSRRRDAARFLVVDLDRASTEQQPLVKRFSSGFIPTLAVLDAKGVVVYDRSGETARERGDLSGLEDLLRRAKRATAP